MKNITSFFIVFLLGTSLLLGQTSFVPDQEGFGYGTNKSYTNSVQVGYGGHIGALGVAGVNEGVEGESGYYLTGKFINSSYSVTTPMFVLSDVYLQSLVGDSAQVNMVVKIQQDSIYSLSYSKWLKNVDIGLMQTFFVEIPDGKRTGNIIEISFEEYIVSMQSLQNAGATFLFDNIRCQYDYSGNIVYLESFGDVTEVSDDVVTPKEFLLHQNYPNPFNPSTVIKYTVSKTSDVSLKIYDVLGNEITALVNEEKPAGEYEATFNAADLSSGTYFYTLSVNGQIRAVKNMVLIK